MSQRKEIKVGTKKKVTFQNSYEHDHQMIFSLKRKQGEQNLDQLYLQNDEEIQRLLNSRKQKKLNMDDLIRKTNQLSISNQNIFVLEKLQFNDEDKDKDQTVEKSLIQIKRDQFVTKLQKEAREKIFDQKRKKMIIQLEQDRNLLTCIEQTTKYEQEEDYYVIKQVNKDQIDQKAIKFQFDTKNIDKYFDNYYDPNDDKISVDSEDSQRSNQDHYDYPDESSSDQNDNHDDDDDYNNYKDDDSYECKRYQRKDIQDEDIEVDEEPIETFKNQTQDFLSFIKQHNQLSKEKKEWKTFNYEEDF